MTRQRGGYLHIIGFIEIPQIEKACQASLFPDTDTNKARNVRSFDTKAIPLKCTGAAVPLRGAARWARLGTATQRSVSRSVVKAWPPSCERPSRQIFDQLQERTAERQAMEVGANLTAEIAVACTTLPSPLVERVQLSYVCAAGSCNPLVKRLACLLDSRYLHPQRCILLCFHVV